MTFEESTSYLYTGMRLRLFTRESVIAWADQKIAEFEKPPFWLLQLATWKNQDSYDLASTIPHDNACGTPDIEAGAILAMFPDFSMVPEQDLGRVARFIYHLVSWLCDSDWTLAIVCDSCTLSDTFDLILDGTTSWIPMHSEFDAFLRKHARPDLAAELRPLELNGTFLS